MATTLGCLSRTSSTSGSLSFVTDCEILSPCWLVISFVPNLKSTLELTLLRMVTLWGLNFPTEDCDYVLLRESFASKLLPIWNYSFLFRRFAMCCLLFALIFPMDAFFSSWCSLSRPSRYSVRLISSSRSGISFSGAADLRKP